MRSTHHWPFQGNPLSRAIMLACLSTIISPTIALAQAVPPSSTAQATQVFNIPAGSLDQVLNQFAVSTGILLAINGSLTEGLTSQGLNGTYSVENGLSNILAGSGLTLRFTGENSVTIEKMDTDVVQLAPISVTGTVITDGSAELGYRSHEVSQVGPWQGRVLDDLPYSITVLPADLIQNVGGSSPDQLIRINPTTQLTRSQHENLQSTASLRGFRTSRSYNDGLAGSTYGQHTALEDAERIEVLTGLSGFLYGPGNIGGVLNYVSKQPTAERLNRVTLSNNGGDNYHLHGDFGGSIDPNGRFGYRVNVAHQDGETAVDRMDIRMSFASAVLDWRPTDEFLLRFNYTDRYYKATGRQPYWSVGAGAQRPSAKDIDNTRSWGQPWTQLESDNTRYGVSLQYDPASWLTFRGALQKYKGNESTSSAWNTFQVDGTFIQTVSGIYAPGVNPGFTYQDDESAYLFADMRFETGNISHQLTTGMQYSSTTQKRFENSASTLTTQTGAQLETGPVYVSRPIVEPIDRGDRVGPVWAWTYTTLTLADDIQFNEQWSLLAGLSWSKYDDPEITVLWPTDGYKKSAVTPSLSVIYKPLPWLTTYASYMEALEKGGSAAQEYGGQPVVNAGQVFKPLISDQIEVGAKFSVGGMLLTTALFEINKGLQYYDLTDPTVPRYVQDGSQVHRGLEFTAVGKATDQLTLIGGFTLLDAQVREQKQNPALEGKRPTEVADQFFKLRAEYASPWLDGLTFVGGVNHTSDRYADTMNTDRLESYTLFDIGARYSNQLAGRPWTARFEIQNLTNERYWANASHVGDPRAMTLSFSADF